jgi:hypothetical protein
MGFRIVLPANLSKGDRQGGCVDVDVDNNLCFDLELVFPSIGCSDNHMKFQMKSS